MNEQERNRKLLIWSGVENIIAVGNGDMIWEKNGVNFCLEYFTTSLDSCFMRLVPKYISEVSMLPMGSPSVMSIYAFLFAEWLKVMQEKVEPALALCLAIEKLIEKDD